jgi:predicted amidohydrolase
MLHGAADLFCEFYDELDEAEFRAEFARWSEDRRLDSDSAAVAGDVQRGASLERIRMRINSMRINNHKDVGAQRYACMRGIDRAFACLNTALHPGRVAIPPALAPLAAHVIARGRLDSDSGAHEGALLLRHVTRLGSSQLPEHPRDAFSSVVRVPEPSWRRCDHVMLGPSTRLRRHELADGLKVACVPFIADPDELRFDVRERRSGRFFAVAPRDSPVTHERVPNVIAALDRSGARLAVVPELTLTSGLLKRWQQTLRNRDRKGSCLHWVLVGTGDLRDGQRPTNTAVLLNGRTGEIIARQDKLFPFRLDSDALRRWKLTDRLEDQAIEEDLAPGHRLTVLEAGTMRLAILICEDLKRVTDLAGIIRDMGVSHLVVPVFSRPLGSYRWEHNAAKVYDEATGTTTIVANSLVMRTILGKGEGTSLIVSPGATEATRGCSESAEDLSLFVLELNGTAEAI